MVASTVITWTVLHNDWKLKRNAARRTRSVNFKVGLIVFRCLVPACAVSNQTDMIGILLAERVGFEPTIPLPVYHLSRVASSTAPAPLQVGGI